MKVVVSDIAKDHLHAIDKWWRHERPAASDLFVEELSDALDLLARMPLIGARWPQ